MQVVGAFSLCCYCRCLSDLYFNTTRPPAARSRVHALSPALPPPVSSVSTRMHAVDRRWAHYVYFATKQKVQKFKDRQDRQTKQLILHVQDKLLRNMTVVRTANVTYHCTYTVIHELHDSTYLEKIKMLTL